jgi:hypothetical protein
MIIRCTILTGQAKGAFHDKIVLVGGRFWLQPRLLHWSRSRATMNLAR